MVHNTKYINNVVARIGSGSGDAKYTSALAAVQHRRVPNKLVSRERQVDQNQQKRTTVKRMLAIDRQAMVDSGLCCYQWSFAEAARISKKPCSRKLGCQG